MKNLQNHRVCVHRSKLIETLKLNRSKHEADYLEAVSLFKEVSRKKMEEAAEKARKSIDETTSKFYERLDALTDEEIPKQDAHQYVMGPLTSVLLDVPKSHLDEYDLAIRMFECDISNSIELSYADFRCFIEDDWDWKEEFTRMSGTYKAALAFRNEE